MKFFSTDGIRGKALELIGSNIVLKLGQIIGKISKKVVVGYDPRFSSPQIADLLINSLMTKGCNVDVVGIIPTPMMSFILEKYQYDYGFVITASHNPYLDNGIKIFNSEGKKISKAESKYIKEELNKDLSFSFAENLGKTSYINYLDEYTSYLKSLINFNNRYRILLDLSNGSFSFLKDYLNMENVDIISCSPDGKNINDQVGSLYPEILQDKVIKGNYDYGFAFDGDGDRLIMVDSKNVYDGDDLISILIKYYDYQSVAITKVSNQGLIDYLSSRKIKYRITDVGDINVYQTMIQENLDLGGEPSGHLIFKSHCYSDSFYSFAQILKIINKTSLKTFENYYTVKKDLINIDNKNLIKKDIEIFLNQITSSEDKLVIRESGTEDVIRINFQTKNYQKYQQVISYFARLENN